MPNHDDHITDRTVRLYHTGFQVIREPDIKAGRKNADFGQGFYLSDNMEFSKRWARIRNGLSTYLNCYTFRPEGLKIKHFSRDLEWFEYIYSNRRGQEDGLAEYDVITGPIANDTIYDTWGITTSGLITKQQALGLLSEGHVYIQTVIKTEKALSALSFAEAVLLSGDEIGKYRETVRLEEARFQEQFSERLLKIMRSEK